MNWFPSSRLIERAKSIIDDPLCCFYYEGIVVKDNYLHYRKKPKIELKGDFENRLLADLREGDFNKPLFDFLLYLLDFCEDAPESFSCLTKLHKIQYPMKLEGVFYIQGNLLARSKIHTELPTLTELLYVELDWKIKPKEVLFRGDGSVKVRKPTLRFIFEIERAKAQARKVCSNRKEKSKWISGS